MSYQGKYKPAYSDRTCVAPRGPIEVSQAVSGSVVNAKRKQIMFRGGISEVNGKRLWSTPTAYNHAVHNVWVENRQTWTRDIPQLREGEHQIDIRIIRPYIEKIKDGEPRLYLPVKRKQRFTDPWSKIKRCTTDLLLSASGYQAEYTKQVIDTMGDYGDTLQIIGRYSCYRKDGEVKLVFYINECLSRPHSFGKHYKRDLNIKHAEVGMYRRP